MNNRRRPDRFYQPEVICRLAAANDSKFAVEGKSLALAHQNGLAPCESSRGQNVSGDVSSISKHQPGSGFRAARRSSLKFLLLPLDLVVPVVRNAQKFAARSGI